MGTNLNNASNGIYPFAQLQDISNEQFHNLTDSNNATFAARKTSVAENISEQIDKNRDNSPNNTYKLLEDRKVENTTKQDDILRAYKRNKKIIIALLFAIAPLIITSVVVSPFFAIGIALSVILVAILTVINNQKLHNVGNFGLQNISIDILFNALKDYFPTFEISAEDNTELLNILANAVNSACTKELIDNINAYNATPINHLSSLSRWEMRNFVINVFNDYALTAKLRSLNFNTDNVKASARDYSLDLLAEQIAKVILGKHCKL